MPVAATIVQATGFVTVTFDQALQPGVSVAANWNAFADLGVGHRRHFPVVAATIAGSAVTYASASAPNPPTATAVDYRAAPPDVFGLFGGLPAPAIDKFPLAIV